MSSNAIVTFKLNSVAISVPVGGTDPVVASYQITCSDGQSQTLPPSAVDVMSAAFVLQPGSYTFTAAGHDAAGKVIGTPAVSGVYVAVDAHLVTVMLPSDVTVTAAP